MDPYFRDQLEGLKKASEHLIAAHQELASAGTALVQVVDAALHAKDEHEDLRVTVNRLEQLVLELRDRLNGREHP
jgi:hypothetical protein